MDFESSTDCSQFSGFSASDIQLDYHDNNVGSIYDINITCMGECISITFHNQSDFDSIMAGLSAIYDFTQNQPKTGRITTTTLGNEKLVITAYNSRKILVQGNEAIIWRNTVFRSLADSITSNINSPIENYCQSSTVKPVKPTPKKQITKSKSTGLISSVTNAIFGPPISSGMTKLGKELKKAKKSERKGGPKIDYEEFKRQFSIIQETGKKPKQKLHKMGQSKRPINYRTNRNEETNPKIICSTNVSNASEETVPKQLQYSEQNSPTAAQSALSTCNLYLHESITEINQGNSLQRSTSTSTNSILDMVKCDIATQCDIEDENRTKLAECLQVSSKLKYENQKLKSSNRDLMKKNKQKCNTDNSELNAKILILEEDIKKIQITNQSLKQENKALKEKLSFKQSQMENKDTLLTDISAIKEQISDFSTTLNLVKERTENIPSNMDLLLLQAEVRNLRKELADNIVNQNNTVPSQDNEANITSLELPEPSSLVATSDINTAKAQEENIREKKSKVLVLGDSVTQGLNGRKMSTNQIQVNIKSHSGATVKDINKAIKQQETRPKAAEEADLIIIHAGINNISNADKPARIKEEFQELTDSIKKINSTAKIMVSSVLPKKRDLLSTENISTTNNLLEKMCMERGYKYIDSHTAMLKEGKVSQSLYYDEIHLNKTGSVVLGKQLNVGIRDILGIQHAASDDQVNFQRAYRPPGINLRPYHPNRQQSLRYHQQRNNQNIWPRNPWVMPNW